MRLPSAFGTLAAILLAGVTRAEAADTKVATVGVRVEVSSRTSLRVSSELLQFSILDGSGAATATVDFYAGVRVPGGSDVVLTVEPVQSIEGPGGAADVDATVAYSGEGQGLVSGQLTGGPSVVGRWRGSGLRRGHLVFTLHALPPGVYTMPVRLVVSTP